MKPTSISELTAEFGVILFTENFEACVQFYEHTLGLQVIERTPDLVSFRFGSSYLMVERGGHGSPTQKPRRQNPCVLRFNTDDMDTAIELLNAKGLDVQPQTFDWGTIAAFTDPDGNLCELKSPALVGA
ncbi:Glyoxalase-like domain protein [Pseudovibrio sp. W64]|uniref:VOC family protein n=1 Tax=Pseudovibrio sp. W64 TaxID=1735583 RepID=UPI0007AE6E4C|nr:VOC family protein [Pseudovibrio sp. W64]KZK78398.1 Glyoxalase-like domain protein [Pseudovibrio sp. W64]